MRKLKNILAAAGIMGLASYGIYRSYNYVARTFDRCSQKANAGEIDFRNTLQEQQRPNNPLNLPQSYKLLEEIVGGRYAKERPY